MSRSSWFIVIALLSGLWSRVALAEDTLTGDQVKTICTTLNKCSTADKDLLDFCDLANSNPTPGSSWDTATVPTKAKLTTATCSAAGAPNSRAPIAAALAAPAVASQSAAGSPGPTESNIVWGATEFLLNRASAELEDWAVDRFVGLICKNGTYAKLDEQPIFPNSCKVLDTLSLDGFMGGLSALQSAMKLDFAHMPVLVLNYLHDKLSDPTAQDALGVGMLLADVLEANLDGTTGIASIPAALKIKPLPPVRCKAVAAAPPKPALAVTPATTDVWELMMFISALPQDTTKKTLLPENSEPKATTDPYWRYALMAFGVEAGDSTTTFGSGWPSDCRNGAKFAFNPSLLFSATATVQSSRDAIAKDVSALNALPSNADISVRMQLYAKIVADTLAPFAGLIAADPALTGETAWLRKAVADANKTATDLASGSYGNVVVDLMQTITDFADQSDDWVALVARLASFGSDVAQATSADAVSAAIDRAAAPVGTYKRKRIGGAYLEVNGYVGLSAAMEYSYGDGNQLSGAGGKWGFAPGVWAPIGLEAGSGRVGCGNAKGSLGVLLQAVDLGALATWRISGSGDPVSSPPNVTIAQVLSPGLAFVYGFPDAPISLALRSELSPNLRQVGQTGETRNAIQVGASVAVDVPIFP